MPILLFLWRLEIMNYISIQSRGGNKLRRSLRVKILNAILFAFKTIWIFQKWILLFVIFPPWNILNKSFLIYLRKIRLISKINFLWYISIPKNDSKEFTALLNSREFSPINVFSENWNKLHHDRNFEHATQFAQIFYF